MSRLIESWRATNPRTPRPLLHRVLGIFFILAGILGLFLPFLQGIVLIIVGLYLLTGRHWRVLLKEYKRRRDRNL